MGMGMGMRVSLFAAGSNPLELRRWSLPELQGIRLDRGWGPQLLWIVHKLGHWRAVDLRLVDLWLLLELLELLLLVLLLAHPEVASWQVGIRRRGLQGGVQLQLLFAHPQVTLSLARRLVDYRLEGVLVLLIRTVVHHGQEGLLVEVGSLGI